MHRALFIYGIGYQFMITLNHLIDRLGIVGKNTIHFVLCEKVEIGEAEVDLV